MNNSIWNYIKNYKYNSLFVRNFLLIVFFIVIPLLGMNIAVYSYYNSIASDEIRKSNTNDVYNMRDIMDMIYLETDRLSLRISSEPLVEEFMNYKKPEKMNSTTIALVKGVQNILSTINIVPDYIDSILIYAQRSGYVISSVKAVDGAVTDLNKAWLSPYENSDKSKKNWYAGVRVPEDETEHIYLSGYRRTPLYSNEKLGVVITNIDTEKLKNFIQSKSSNRNLLILDADNTLIYNDGSNNEDIEAYIEQLGEREEYSFFNKQQDVVSMVRSKYNDWTFIATTPTEQYHKRLVQLKNYMLLSIFFSILISVGVAFFVSLRVFNPIKKIIEVVNQPDKAGLNLNGQGSNEFNFIVHNISSSFMENEMMKEELVRRQEIINRAQSIALQSQINPHFLYNTLENINWKVMGLTGGDNECSNMISLLSRLLRNSLQTEKYVIPVSEELEHGRLYIDIQKTRYEDKFDVIWDINDDVLDCMIVKLSIQPLIENAIYHGVKMMEEKGMIKISARKDSSNVIILIEDDGIGMTQDKIDEINNDLKNDYIKENEHIGIYNVNQRMRLHFGGEYGLNLMKNKNRGITVRIVIPIIY